MMTRFDNPECNDPPCTVRRYLWYSLNIKFTDYLPNDVFARLMLSDSVHETLTLSTEKKCVYLFIMHVVNIREARMRFSTDKGGVLCKYIDGMSQVICCSVEILYYVQGTMNWKAPKYGTTLNLYGGTGTVSSLRSLNAFF
jgi:hypothetical protein